MSVFHPKISFVYSQARTHHTHIFFLFPSLLRIFFVLLVGNAFDTISSGWYCAQCSLNVYLTAYKYMIMKRKSTLDKYQCRFALLIPYHPYIYAENKVAFELEYQILVFSRTNTGSMKIQ